MKHLIERQVYRNDKSLKTSDEMDEIVKTICLPFTDAYFNLEVLYHIGTNSYTLFKDINRVNYYLNNINDSDCLTRLHEYNNLDKFAEQMGNLADDLKFISSEVGELTDRLMDIQGIEQLDMTKWGAISFGIRVKYNNDKKYKNMLSGDPSQSQYH